MFQSAEFWVAVAFVIFWGILFYYGVPGKVLGQLDSRGKRIAGELAEAKRLRQDAERLLKEYEANAAPPSARPPTSSPAPATRQSASPARPRRRWPIS